MLSKKIMGTSKPDQARILVNVLQLRHGLGRGILITTAEYLALGEMKISLSVEKIERQDMTRI
ncbi:hypothetical protein BA011_00365 [Rhizobium leguminosarum]|uniref:Uncharacterized protein n=1 Tax=Rhizobium leguminosarum TaxID=384 RepID=A0A1B1C3V9_RHILE|nr:hypothetical protein BA011_00365 [Rhizobium leguminosarum]